MAAVSCWRRGREFLVLRQCVRHMGDTLARSTHPSRELKCFNSVSGTPARRQCSVLCAFEDALPKWLPRERRTSLPAVPSRVLVAIAGRQED